MIFAYLFIREKDEKGLRILDLNAIYLHW